MSLPTGLVVSMATIFWKACFFLRSFYGVFYVTSSPHDMIRTSSLVVIAFIFSELRLCLCVCVCGGGGGGSKLNGVKRYINDSGI